MQGVAFLSACISAPLSDQRNGIAMTDGKCCCFVAVLSLPNVGGICVYIYIYIYIHTYIYIYIYIVWLFFRSVVTLVPVSLSACGYLCI